MKFYWGPGTIVRISHMPGNQVIHRLIQTAQSTFVEIDVGSWPRRWFYLEELE
jgi:hypothetical protein